MRRDVRRDVLMRAAEHRDELLWQKTGDKWKRVRFGDVFQHRVEVDDDDGGWARLPRPKAGGLGTHTNLEGCGHAKR